MEFWSTWSAAYIGVGLLVAAVVYHAFSGGFDHLIEELNKPCECCGRTPQLTHEEREDIHHYEKIQLMRETPRGRFAIAVLTAIMCLICVTVWPVAVVAFAINFYRSQRARRTQK